MRTVKDKDFNKYMVYIYLGTVIESVIVCKCMLVYELAGQEQYEYPK